MATEYNLTIHAGETRVMVVTVTDQYGVPVDLTGAEIVYTALLSTPIVKKVGSGITITDPTAGEYEIALLQDDTVDIEMATRARHEAKILTAGGEVMVSFVGYLFISDSLVGSLPEVP